MKRKLRLDASALKQSACGLKFKRIVIDGYKEPFIYNDTQYGTAVHKFLWAMAVSGGDFKFGVQQATECFKKHTKVRPKKEHLDDKHLIKTCFDYWEWIGNNEIGIDLVVDPNAICFNCKGFQQLDEIGNPVECKYCKGAGTRPQPLTEVTFEYNIHEDDDLEIDLVGTMDRLTKIRNGCYCIRDYKTTSSYNVKQFLSLFELSPQLLFYCWMIKRIGQERPDSVLAKIAEGQIGACIDGIFLKSAKETTFESSIVFQPKQKDLDTFELMLQFKIDELVSHYHEHLKGHDPFPNGKIEGLCSSGFPCMFFGPCAAPDEISANHMLKNNYRQVEYNPLKFGEVE